MGALFTMRKQATLSLMFVLAMGIMIASYGTVPA